MPRTMPRKGRRWRLGMGTLEVFPVLLPAILSAQSCLEVRLGMVGFRQPA